MLSFFSQIFSDFLSKNFAYLVIDIIKLKKRAEFPKILHHLTKILPFSL